MTLNIKDGVIRRIRTIWKPVQTPQTLRRSPTCQIEATSEAPAEGVPFQRFLDVMLTALLPHHEAREALLIAFRREGIIPCT